MANTLLILRGNVVEPIVEVDGKKIPFKKDKISGRQYEIATVNNFCELKIYTLKHELSEPYWWLFAFLFYLVSIFGIFNTFYPKKFYTINYVGVLNATVPILELQFNSAKQDFKALNCLRGYFDDNPTNVYGFDKKAKSRRRLCFWLKLASWVVIAAVTVLILIFK